MSQVRIALVAPSGSGKSTTAGLIVEHCARLGLRAEVLKLAEPLYRLQGAFYQIAGRRIDHYAQNQKLLETIATELRAIDPTALVGDLRTRLERCDAEVIVNDDLRDTAHDLPALRAMGFRIVKISADSAVIARRLDRRQDLDTVRESPLDRMIRAIEPDHVIANTGQDLQAYRGVVNAVTASLVAERRAVHAVMTSGVAAQ